MYRLSDSLPYRLNRLGTRLGSLFTQRIADFGLTLPMYQTLVSLAERPDQRLNDLAATISMSLPTASRMIGTLVERNLVSRERDPDHERAVRINLTAEGRQTAQTLLQRAEHYAEVASSLLDPAEVEQLKAWLDRIYTSLDILEGELHTPKRNIA
jgi:DNA-binding MarR family transcriptional regulator